VPQLMVTDPPYGVEYDPGWRHRRGVNNSARKGKIKNDEIADWTPTWNLFPGEIAYVWHGALRSSIVAESDKLSTLKFDCRSFHTALYEDFRVKCYCNSMSFIVRGSV